MRSILFNWEHQSPENLVFRLYEDGIMIVDNIGAMNFTLSMEGKADGVYAYYLTSFDTTTKLESVPSETVNVNFIPPQAPTGFRGSLIG